MVGTENEISSFKIVIFMPLGICRPNLPQHSSSYAPVSIRLLYTRNIKRVEHQKY
jgi:hypothetical protein